MRAGVSAADDDPRAAGSLSAPRDLAEPLRGALQRAEAAGGIGAPATAPASSPTDITTSGERSALTPKIEIWETAVCWITTVANARTTSRSGRRQRVMAQTLARCARGGGA